MKRISSVLAVMLCATFAGCASTGTKVSADSDMYKSMARSQQGWCSQFGCGCSIDGLPTTCSLVAACLHSGNCKQVAQ
jgi:hypothetical protein